MIGPARDVTWRARLETHLKDTFQLLFRTQVVDFKCFHQLKSVKVGRIIINNIYEELEKCIYIYNSQIVQNNQDASVFDGLQI